MLLLARCLGARCLGAQPRLLELNHGEGDVRVDVGVTVLGCMHLRHRLDLILDRFLNFGGVDVIMQRLLCKALIMQFDNCDWTLPGGYALPDCALTACIA